MTTSPRAISLPLTVSSTGAPAIRGGDQLAHALADIRRAADHGFRSVLIADVGLLAAFTQMRSAGELPATMQAKVSVMLAVANPAAARIIVDLGADTLNLPTDLSLAQIAAVRSVVDVPLDLYVEAPDNLGGDVSAWTLGGWVQPSSGRRC